MKNIIEGSGITHRWPLNIENVHEIEDDQYETFDGDDTVFWDLGLPAAGYCWVLSSITMSFDMEPVLPGILAVDGLAGAIIWYITWIGRSPNLLAVASPNGPFKFHFTPALKFPVNQDIAINWLGTDASVIGVITWEVWQELESV